MSIIYVGDLHGRLDLSKILQYAEAKQKRTGEKVAVVQVGDLGLFWPSKRASKRFHITGPEKWNTSGLDRWFQKRAYQGKWTVPIYTPCGNHDNWNVLYELWEEQGRPDKVELYPNSGLYYISRGSIIDIDGISHLFMGGAESTDKHLRTPDLTWWDREEPNREEWDRFAQMLENKKPNTVVSHDAPLRVKLGRARRNSSPTPRMLESAIKISGHKPKHWFFGHHHIKKRWKILGTKFHCCGLHGEYWERK